MLSDIARFLALISALVFVHEFGHFVWARIFGVRVLKFSLGFGPRVLGFRLRETEYCISLIPLGGFVKMLGEDPSERVAVEDLPRAFHQQALWKRFVIVLAGPLTSLLFPVLLYFSVFLSQTTLTPPILGTVFAGYPAEGKLLPGDTVTAVDGSHIGSFQDLRERIADAPDRDLRIDFVRDGRARSTVLSPESVRLDRSTGLLDRVGRAGISASFQLPILGVRGPRSPAWVAGLRSFDIVTMYHGDSMRRWAELERALSQSRGATVPVAFLRPIRVENTLGGLADIEVFDPGLAQLTPEPGVGEYTQRTGIESPDLYVSDVRPESAEYQMGLRRGDRVLSLDGVIPPSWERLRERLSEPVGRLCTLRFMREGREVQGAFGVRPSWFTDELGQRYPRVSVHMDHWLPGTAEAPIANPSRVSYAVRHALRETLQATRYLSLGIVRLVQGKVPIRSVGGPIMIYDVSRSTASDGLWGLLWVMALVSINLGLLNLLPIPTLDGGHLMFFVLEAVLRRPVPLWMRQIASVFGLALLLTVMVVAFRNDLDRKFNPPAALPSSAYE